MKAIQFGIFALLLAACSPAMTFYPYDGTKYITGEGGFYEGQLRADTLGHSLFEAAQNTNIHTLIFTHLDYPKAASAPCWVI